MSLTLHTVKVQNRVHQRTMHGGNVVVKTAILRLLRLQHARLKRIPPSHQPDAQKSEVDTILGRWNLVHGGL